MLPAPHDASREPDSGDEMMNIAMDNDEDDEF